MSILVVRTSPHYRTLLSLRADIFVDGPKHNLVALCHTVCMCIGPMTEDGLSTIDSLKLSAPEVRKESHTVLG